jgi:pilus assembly protein CpaE
MSAAHDLRIETGGEASRQPGRGGKERHSCVAFVRDEQTRATITAVCEGQFPTLAVREGGSREALAYLGDAPPPRVLIVDLSDAAKPLSAVLPIMAAFAEETRVIAIGAVNDINLYRDMIEAGVVEYLVKPVPEAGLSAALARVENRPAEAPAAAHAKGERRPLVAVLGTRGGVGASTVAVNLAWLMANEIKRKTTLIDLDLQNGTVALALDIEPTRGLREALENPNRIDSLFISSASARLNDRLVVMAAEEGFDDEVHYDPAAIDLLIEEVHRQTDIVLLDLPRNAPGVRNRALAAATDVVIVSDLTLAGLRDAIRLQGLVQHSAPSAHILFVANRVGGKEVGVPKTDFQRALGQPLEFLLPEDPKAVVSAANAGKPLVAAAPGSKTAAPLRAIAARLCRVAPARRNLLFWRHARKAGK